MPVVKVQPGLPVKEALKVNTLSKSSAPFTIGTNSIEVEDVNPSTVVVNVALVGEALKLKADITF